MGKKSKKSTADVIAKRLARQQAAAFVPRPFEGLPFETDLVSLRELVPAATATAKLTEEYGGDDVTFATLLPAAWQAMNRQDGVLMAGLQTPHSSPDPSRDLAAAILKVKEQGPGAYAEPNSNPGEGPRLQDILDTSVPFKVTVKETFDYWLPEEVDLPEDSAFSEEQLREGLEQANQRISPTEKLVSAEGCYWTEMAGRCYVRWAFTEPEDTVMDGLARLHAAGENNLGGLGKYLGCFRAHGIVIPVWELNENQTPDDVDAALGDFAKKLHAAMDETGSLTPEQRRAKSGVVSRQLTIR